MKKELLKPEIEIIKFYTQDVITASGDTYSFSNDPPTDDAGNAHDGKDYGN